MSMSTLKSYKFVELGWISGASEIMDIREKVFVIEQRFDKEVLCDEEDGFSIHVLAIDEYGQAIGCGRLTPKGRVGRMAVLIGHRGEGVGTMLLTQLMKIAERKKLPNVSLNVETELTHFYDQQKFSADGPVYMKQGIPFQRMKRNLA